MLAAALRPTIHGRGDAVGTRAPRRFARGTGIAHWLFILFSTVLAFFGYYASGLSKSIEKMVAQSVWDGVWDGMILVIPMLPGGWATITPA